MLPDELRQRAFAEARRLGISFGEFVREAMHAALAPARRKGPRTDSLLCDRAERYFSTALFDLVGGERTAEPAASQIQESGGQVFSNLGKP